MSLPSICTRIGPLVAVLLACGSADGPADTDATNATDTTDATGETTPTTGTPPTGDTGETGEAVCSSESAVKVGFNFDLHQWPTPDGAYDFDAPCKIEEFDQQQGAATSLTLLCTDDADVDHSIVLAISGEPAPVPVYLDGDLDVTLKVRVPAGAFDDEGSFALFYGGDMVVAGTNAPGVGDPDLFGMFTVSAVPQDCTAGEYAGCATAQTFDLVIDGGPLSDAHYSQGFMGTEGSQVYLSIAIERAMQVTSDPMTCPLDQFEANTFKFMLTYSPV